MLLSILKKFEKSLIQLLMGLMAIVLVLGTLDLGWFVIQNIITPPYVLFDVNLLLDVFGAPDHLAEFLLHFVGQATAQTSGFAPFHGQRKIFAYCHIGGRSTQGVLKNPPDVTGSFMLRPTRYVYSVQYNSSFIHRKRSRDGVQQGGFARSVGPQHTDKTSFLQGKGHPLQGIHLIDCPLIECLLYIIDLKHAPCV